MALLAATLTILTGLAALIWCSRIMQLRRFKAGAFVIDANAPGPPPSAPKISVVVAAKDEEIYIESCLRTMLAQDYPDFEVIVCNDRSGDNTAAIIDRVARGDSRVKVVTVDQLPEGWCGKNNAMQQAIARSEGEWICMIDADCRQESPRTLSATVQHAIDGKIDLLSVLPTLEMHSFWETVVQPVCSGTMMIWFNPMHVNDPRKPHAYANGAFMLMRRAAYDAIGTHHAVRNRLCEDMHIAALVKRSGLCLRVVPSSGLYRVRMYSSLAQAVQGWTRIFFGTFGTVGRLVVSWLAMFLVGSLPWLTLAAAGWAILAGSASPWWPAASAASAAAVICQMISLYHFYRQMHMHPALSLLYPVGNLIGLYILLLALSKHLPSNQVVWRNTSYARP
ncbi:MAG: glycosyltransferase [Planctomycetaceae bacterium]|nr:glycosyltransferase [Planctomycetaceae bacterium]